MFNLFKKKVKMISGVLPDIRIKEEKNKDYLTEEILVMVTPLNWIPWESWKAKLENIKMLFEIKVNNQNNVGSCAAQALSLLLSILNWIEDKIFIILSSKPVYGRRKNKPSPGMYMDDVGNIGITYATVPEVLYPSPNDTEENMSNLDDYISAFESMAKVLRAKNYFWLYQTKDIDSFAQILSLGKPIVLTVVFGDGEFDKMVPEVKSVPVKYGHAITILPNAYFTYQGKKAVLIQNSWGDFRYYGGRQILTEDWFIKNRVICGMWFEDLNNLAVFNSDIAKPKYHFANDLYVGMQNSEVAMLQRCLGYEKDDDGYIFPLYQSPTGYFGGITRNAVKRFQIKYGIEPVLGYCGPKTRTKLNKLFS